MSEKLHEAVEEVEVVEELPEFTKQFKLRKITVRVVLPITRYLKEVKLLDLLIAFLNGGEEEEIATTWADIRQERNMTMDELNELKAMHNGNIGAALGDIGMVAEKGEDATTKLIRQVIEIITDEASFSKSVEMIAYLFEVDEEEVYDLEIKELIALIRHLMSNKDFLSVL